MSDRIIVAVLGALSGGFVAIIISCLVGFKTVELLLPVLGAMFALILTI